MTAVAIEWPGSLIPSRAMFHLEMTSRTGGASISGSEQIVLSPAGRWRARIDIPIHTERKVLAYRAMMAQLAGRVGTILVPKWENFGPFNMNGRRLQHRAVASSGLNFDGSGFGQDEFVYATLDGSAVAGASQITANLVDGEGPQPGQYIGFRNRLHLVQNVWQAEVGDPSKMQFMPWLREALPSGERIILDRPVCLMRLASDTSGELMLDDGNVGQASLEFVEAI